MEIEEFIMLIVAVMFTFFFLIWVGKLAGQYPKLFYYGKFRKFFKWVSTAVNLDRGYPAIFWLLPGFVEFGIRH